MQNFQIENTEMIFLDHIELINNSYNSEQFNCNYVLNPKLFEYNEREQKPNTKRKRKKPLRSELQVESVEGNSAINEEISDLKKVSQATTNYLKASTDRFNSEIISGSSSFQIDFLEEERPFVSIQGRNENPIAHITEIPALCKSTKFLIPARSKFFNCDVLNSSEYSNSADKYDLVIMDPPWRNKYIRRLKKAKEGLGYKMMTSDSLVDIPLNLITNPKCLLVIWCTNSSMHQSCILEKLLPSWDMKLLSKWYWVKLNTSGNTVCEFQQQGQKQPFEVLYIATRNENKDERLAELAEKKVVFSVPSIIHSHKPPIFEIFKKYLPNEPKCLELFARYLQPYFTSVGLEVLKLMDLRLYNCKS